MKKAFSILLVGLFAICMFTSCNGSENLSSALVSSEVAQGESTSSENSEIDDNKNSSVATTSSPSQNDQTSSGGKPVFDRYTSSESESQSVKVYTNKGTVGIGAYTFRMDLCTASGSDYESKLQEFSDVVKEGYFNTYFLTLDSNLLTQMEIIAEAGGSVWFSCTRDIQTKGLDAYIKSVEYYLDLLEEAGYRDLVNGFYWYEPLWQSTLSNEDFLLLTKTIYQKFGLRNFPALPPHNFTDITGNETNEEADAANKLLTANLKYVTDIAYTGYSVDLREGVNVSDSTLKKWQSNISPNIKSNKDYHIGYKEKLQAHVGHPVNTWYYACAFETGVSVGLNGIIKADEDYCIGHLEAMAEDVLDSEYQGGIVLHKYNVTGSTYGLQHHLPVKDARGRYKYYPQIDKWDRYGGTLKKIRADFDSRKANLAKIK